MLQYPEQTTITNEIPVIKAGIMDSNDMDHLAELNTLAPIVVLNSMLGKIYLINDPKIVRNIFKNKDLQPSSLLKMLLPKFLGRKSVVLGAGQEHAKQRRL